MPTTTTAPATKSQRAGLCATCRQADVITSSRGAIFYRCRRSESDPTFRKYPTLPVLVCRGYDPESAA